MRRLIVFEANQRLVDHPHRPFDLSEIGIEPEGDRSLDQSLEKRLIGIFGFLIELLQSLMRLKKSALIKQTYALPQTSIHNGKLRNQRSNFSSAPQGSLPPPQCPARPGEPIFKLQFRRSKESLIAIGNRWSTSKPYADVRAGQNQRR